MTVLPSFPSVHDVQALALCRRLFLRGFEVPVQIGIHDFEKLGPQRIIFDVDLYVPLEATTPTSDQISEVVDYDFVRQVILQRIARGPIGLQETLCDDVLDALLAHPGLVAARVSTRKPDVYPDCDAVGVEVLRFRPQAAP
jgi:dihydroneopterin aldolase